MPVSRLSEEHAHRRAEEWMSLVRHASAFVVVNALIWVVDLGMGSGLGWAAWVTIPWALGLLFHVADFVLGGSSVNDRKFDQLIEQEFHVHDQFEHR